MITLPTPILVMSFAASKIFKASLKQLVFANLASAINRMIKKITNRIKTTVMVVAKELTKGASTGDIILNVMSMGLPI